MIAIDVRLESQLLTKRGHKKVMRKILRQAGTRIRQNLPKHFERNAKTSPGGAYEYEKRSRKYQIRKAKSKGHQKPLVFTGRMRQAIMSNAKVTGTSTKATVRTRNYFPMKVQRRKEIETVSQDEIREIQERMKRDYLLLATRPEFQQYQRKRTRN